MIRSERPFYSLLDGSVICSPEGYAKLRAEMQRREIQEKYLRPQPSKLYPGLDFRDLFRLNVQDRPRNAGRGPKSEKDPVT